MTFASGKEMDMSNNLCCEQFKEEFNADPIHQDDIHRDEMDGNIYFFFEGCRASGSLKFCPYCGAKL